MFFFLFFLQLPTFPPCSKNKLCPDVFLMKDEFYSRNLPVVSMLWIAHVRKFRKVDAISQESNDD